jgi:ferredoxin-type protein NapF
MSPYLVICSTIATRALGLAALIGLPVLVIVLISRRWLCRSVCPVGLLVDVVAWLRPTARTNGVKLPPIGQWAALLTIGGAVLGYPLLLWMDPLAMFSGFFGWTRHALGAAGLVSAIGLPLVLLLTAVLPNAWCERICPLGATQDLLAAPAQALRRRKSSTPVPSPEQVLARRSVLAMAVGAAWAVVTMRLVRGERSKPIRPPGAVDERRFAGVCVRCGNCVRACPTGIISPDLGALGISGFLSPVVRFDNGYCLETCRRCTEVCPSGAISRLSLEAKRKAVMGIAKVDMSVCLLSEGEECTVCAARCPYDALTIAFDEKDYSSKPRVTPEKCPGCGACEAACPTSPKAIAVRRP